MATDNHTTIVGNLVDDPELRFTNNGIAVTNMRVAVTQRVQQDGEWRDGDTSFLKVNVWRGQAEHLADSLAKGDRVMVTGRLRQRSWETPEGDKRSVTEIEADEVGASLKWATAGRGGRPGECQDADTRGRPATPLRQPRGRSGGRVPGLLIPVRQAGAAGGLSRRWRRRNRQQPRRPSTVIPCRSDLDPRAAVGRQRHDHRVAPDPLDLTRLGRPRLSCKAVDGHQLVPEQHRRLGPDEHIADQRP